MNKCNFEKMEDFFKSVKENIIDVLIKNNVFIDKEIIKSKEFFQKEFEKLIYEKNKKISDNEIYDYTIEVLYVFFIFPGLDIKDVIECPDKALEYWDFFFENYPNLVFAIEEGLAYRYYYYVMKNAKKLF